MKRTAAQDAQYRTYKGRANAKLMASFAEPLPPEDSWWVNANGEFYERARKEHTRMQGSQFGKLHKLITASGLTARDPRASRDETAELTAGESL